MTELVSGERFADLFRTFSHWAWRWEAQGTYHQPGEVEPWQRWREGVPVRADLEWKDFAEIMDVKLEQIAQEVGVLRRRLLEHNFRRICHVIGQGG